MKATANSVAKAYGGVWKPSTTVQDSEEHYEDVWRCLNARWRIALQMRMEVYEGNMANCVAMVYAGV